MTPAAPDAIDQIPAHGMVLAVRNAATSGGFVRPPLLIVTGTRAPGIDHFARLAGRIPGAVLLDADVFASDMISVVPPNEDYPAFWRSMARLAHEISQNNLAVVFFSVMLPQQLLANTDVLEYFESVSFLCLRCDAEVLRTRLMRRAGSGATRKGLRRPWTGGARFNDVLIDAASSINDVHVIDATRPVGEVESGVRGGYARLQSCS